MCFLLAVLATGCIIPFATPPLRGEVGGATRAGRASEHGSRSFHAAVGTHLASGTQREAQPFDIGAGWTFEKTAESTSNGFYVDAALFIDRARAWRTSVGARGEMRWVQVADAMMEDSTKAFAAKLRIDSELFASGQSDFTGHDKCGSSSGTHYGTTAIGLYVEGGRVWSVSEERNAWVATAGLTVRLPSAVGVWIGIPGC